MADEDKGGDPKWDVFVNRIEAAFPKLKGPKLDKLLLTESNKDSVRDFCENENVRCLVCPGETITLEETIPSKIGKTKVLLFIRLSPSVLTMENIHTDVSNLFCCCIYCAQLVFLACLSVAKLIEQTRL